MLGGEPGDIPEHVSDDLLWRLLLNVLTDGLRRDRLRHVNTMHDAVRLIKSARRILVLTGAGVSYPFSVKEMTQFLPN